MGKLVQLAMGKMHYPIFESTYTQIALAETIS